MLCNGSLTFSPCLVAEYGRWPAIRSDSAPRWLTLALLSAATLGTPSARLCLVTLVLRLNLRTRCSSAAFLSLAFLSRYEQLKEEQPLSLQCAACVSLTFDTAYLTCSLSFLHSFLSFLLSSLLELLFFLLPSYLLSFLLVLPGRAKGQSAYPRTNFCCAQRG